MTKTLRRSAKATPANPADIDQSASIVKTAMRLPIELRANLKAEAAVSLLKVNDLYLHILRLFVRKGLSAPREAWVQSRSLKGSQGQWCQTPLHLPKPLLQELELAAQHAGTLAKVYVTAMTEYIGKAPWTR